MKNSLFFFIILFLFSCSSDSGRAQKIVDKMIEYAGGDKYLQSTIEFDFRDIHYIGNRNGGKFSYERIITDSMKVIHDVLNNEGFTRRINNEPIILVDSMAAKYARSVNSVLYFTLLPYGLNDPAVIKEYRGVRKVKNQEYYLVKIMFEEEQGGEDFQDVFLYWVNTKNYSVDYFAYSYLTDGGGKRFREKIGEEVVEGIRFSQYNNYKTKEGEKSELENFDGLYESGSLQLLSVIENKNIKVIVHE